MEVPSSTECALNTSASDFRPNTYVEVGKETVEIKLKTLSQYCWVMRSYPHLRSEEAIIGLELTEVLFLVVIMQKSLSVHLGGSHE